MFGNQIKTALLMFVLVILFMALGNAMGGTQGALIGLVIAAGMNFFSYWNSDKMVLSAYKAQEVTESTDPRLYKIVRDLAMRAGLPMPKVYITPEQQPNAFATGRDPKHAAVACTQGLLNMMTDEEIAGVNIPTGIPLVYELDREFHVTGKRYLGDPEAIAAKIESVKNQCKKE